MAAPDADALKKLRLCAAFAKYAYISGKPDVHRDELRRAWPAEFAVKNQVRFFSRSWFNRSGQQHRLFKSHAFICRLISREPEDDKTRIVIGFRGTWPEPAEPVNDLKQMNDIDVADADANHESEPFDDSTVELNVEPPRSWFGKLFEPPAALVANYVLNKWAPANFGLADIYYDMHLIRVPYRKGVVWKWYSYWGTLVLNSTQWVRWFWGWPRRVAAGWISQPNGDDVSRCDDGLVHLGFWSLWASPEGFAGYDHQGRLWKNEHTKQNEVRKGVLQKLHHLLRAVDRSRETEVWITGHSLGGAVSCFAALDVVAELRTTYPHVKIFHATFGAPPVGTPRFAAHFRNEMEEHESWTVYHEKDVVANCFAFLGTMKRLKLLPWWNHWSKVGNELRLRDNKHHSFAPRPGFRLIFLVISASIVAAICAIPACAFISPICWYNNYISFGNQRNPGSSEWNEGDVNEAKLHLHPEPQERSRMTVKHHDMKGYQELLNVETPEWSLPTPMAS